MIGRKEGEMAGIFLCNNPQDEELSQCKGLDDVSTCVDGIECIRSSCGRPFFPHIGISYAGSSDPFDTYAGTSTRSFATWLSVLYSLVPYTLLLYFGIRFLASGNVMQLTRLVLMGFISLVNDAILKHILKQPRPTGSCLYFHAYGMPSGHAATSMGLLAFMLLELLLYHPNLYGRKNVTMIEGSGDEMGGELQQNTLEDPFIFEWGYGWHHWWALSDTTSSLNEAILSDDIVEDARRESSLLTSFDSTLEVTSTPFTQPPANSIRSKWLHHRYALLWTIILLPVPLSRVYLHDHTLLQILVGSVVGTILGIVWFLCIIRGRAFGSNAGRRMLAYLVNCSFGKWAGLNLGKGGGRIEVYCNS